MLDSLRHANCWHPAIAVAGLAAMAALCAAFARSLAESADTYVGSISYEDQKVYVDIERVAGATRHPWAYADTTRRTLMQAQLGSAFWGRSGVFYLGKGQPNGFHFEHRATKGSPLEVMPLADAVLMNGKGWLPDKHSVHSRIVSQCTVDGKVVTLSFDPSAEMVIVAGSIAAVLWACGGRVRILCIDEEDVSLGRRIVIMLEELFAAHDVHSSKWQYPNTLIVTSEQCFGDIGRIPFLSGVFSNVIVGPYSDVGTSLGLRLASLFYEPDREEHTELPAREQGALRMLRADQLQAAAFDGRLLLPSPYYQDRALAMLASLGRKNPDDGLDEARGAWIFAPVLAKRNEQCITEGAVSDMVWSLDETPTLQHFANRLQSRSLVTTELADENGAGKPVTLECVAGYLGFLEDCGCKASAAGGIKRLIYRWEGENREHPSRIILGNMVQFPTKAPFNGPVNRLILAECEHTGVDAYIPGYTELLALATNGLVAKDFNGLNVVCCNVRPLGDGGPQFMPWVDLVLRSGEEVRLIGLLDIPASLVNMRRRELILESFSVDQGVGPLRRALDVAPNGLPIVVGGCFDPALLSVLADYPDKDILVLCGDPDYPRWNVAQPVPQQQSGYIEGHPTIFIQLSQYGVTSVSWNSHSGIEGVVESKLLTQVPPDTGISTRIRYVLESVEGGEPVEREFQDPLLSLGARYVGSAVCGGCHQQQEAHWRETGHAQAMNTLKKIQRQYVQNCVACHVVGFDAPTGYKSSHPREELASVGCEVCHGPGSVHATRPRAADYIRRTPPDDICASCHTVAHSAFLAGHEDEYRALIAH